MADTLAVSNHYLLPVYFLLAAYPEKFENLVLHEESFGSIFHFDNIDCLTDEEVSEFFTDTFKQADIEISPETLEIMTLFSSGLPLMMQQIGESIFWICEDNYITYDEAIEGIIDAADVIGRKQIKPVLNQIRSENYVNILMFLAENQMQSFKRSQIKEERNLSDNILSNFLSRMLELNIIESTGYKIVEIIGSLMGSL